VAAAPSTAARRGWYWSDFISEQELEEEFERVRMRVLLRHFVSLGVH
jgi:hypothetical protein